MINNARLNLLFLIYILMNNLKDYVTIHFIDRRTESCNTLNDLSNRVCVPNKTGDLKLSFLI